MTIRPVYSKLVLPSRKSLEIIFFFFNTKNGGCPLIRACSLIRSNTVDYRTTAPPVDSKKLTRPRPHDAIFIPREFYTRDINVF